MFSAFLKEPIFPGEWLEILGWVWSSDWHFKLLWMLGSMPECPLKVTSLSARHRCHCTQTGCYTLNLCSVSWFSTVSWGGDSGVSVSPLMTRRVTDSPNDLIALKLDNQHRLVGAVLSIIISCTAITMTSINKSLWQGLILNVLASQGRLWTMGDTRLREASCKM